MKREDLLHNKYYIKIITYNRAKVFEENALYYLHCEIAVAEYLQPWRIETDVYIPLSAVWTNGLNCVA